MYSFDNNGSDGRLCSSDRRDFGRRRRDSRDRGWRILYISGCGRQQLIDVSEFQGEEIDWKQVKDSGVEFVIIRLGYRAYGDSGELVLDAMYEQNIQGALEAGLDVGVYFFSQAVNAAEVVYDTEEIKWDTARTDNNTKQEFTNFCKVFCDTIEHAGYESMIYSNMKWMAFTLDMSELSEYDFWYADYHEVPQCPYDYKIWQYSEEGAVPGINGNVDLNLWFKKEEKSK